jgi:hypothetical protein
MYCNHQVQRDSLIILYKFMFTDMVGAKVGLALSQSLIITGMLQHGLLRATEAVSLMTSVERVLDYVAIEKEPEMESAPGKQKTTAQYFYSCATFRRALSCSIIFQ